MIENRQLADDAIRIIERIIINVSGFRYLNGKTISKPFGMAISLNFIRIAALNWCNCLVQIMKIIIGKR